MQRHGCQPSDHPLLGRRELLQVGGLGLFGAGLGDLLRMESQAAEAPGRGTAKSVVFIFQSGGPSQHETFDPNPGSPGKFHSWRVRHHGDSRAGRAVLRASSAVGSSPGSVLDRPHDASHCRPTISERTQQLPLPVAQRDNLAAAG
ncbi:MAG: hypothetical protein Ct9H300mP1_30730 [Planctomycetaceae bacterium]|nr:MAG: hypothetical protein Ct9H300mP1_30730 [Planctomycetaceae bacterium]